MVAKSLSDYLSYIVHKSGRAADSCGPDLRNLTVREIQNVKNFVISFSKIQDYELSKMVKMEKFVDS